MDPEKLIKKSDFARLLEVSKPRVSQMVAMGCPTSDDGLIPVDRALAWVAANVNRVARGPADGVKPGAAEDDLPSLVEARTRLILFQCQRAKLSLEKDGGNLIERAVAAKAVAGYFRLLGDRFVNFGNRYGQQIAAAAGADPKIIMAGIDQAMRAHMAEIAAVKQPDFE